MRSSAATSRTRGSHRRRKRVRCRGPRSRRRGTALLLGRAVVRLVARPRLLLAVGLRLLLFLRLTLLTFRHGLAPPGLESRAILSPPVALENRQRFVLS